MTESPHLLAEGDIDARSRPRGILLVWLWELACGFLLATPIHSWALRAWGPHPDGDAPLFEPGGHALLTWLGDPGPALSIVVRAELIGLVVFALLGQLVTGALVASIATGRGDDDRAPATTFTLAVGAQTFVPLLVTTLVFASIQGAVLGIGLFASAAVDDSLQTSLGDARSFTARVVALVPFALGVLFTGIVADFARVAIVRDAVASPAERLSTWQVLRAAFLAALGAALRAPFRASVAWGWRAVLSLALVYVAARIGDSAGARGGATLWLLFGGHQLIALSRVVLRASWLAKALRLVVGTTKPAT